MAFPVTVEGSFTCRHSGTVSLGAAPPAAVDGRLTIRSGKVVLFDGLFPGAPFAALYDHCTASTPPAQCFSTTALPQNPGRSGLLTVNRVPVLLDSLKATSQAANTPLNAVAAGQSVLTAT